MRTANFGISAILGLGLLAGCSHDKPMQHIDNGALVRLNEQQMRPVDDARIEEGRARDNVARAKAAVQDAKAKIDIAKAEKDVAVAQQKRSKAELDLLNQQKADLKDIDHAKNDLVTADQRLQAVDRKIDYLNRSVGIAQLEEGVAQQHAAVTEAAVERAKFQALQAANSNEIRGMNAAVIDQRLAESQAKEAQLRKEAADKRVELVDSYNKWQELDAKVRTAPLPLSQEPSQPNMPSQPVNR